jgi:hypothetical protein
VEAGKREVAVDKADAVAVVLDYLRQRLGVEAGAERALEVAELDDRNRGVLGPLAGIIVTVASTRGAAVG